MKRNSLLLGVAFAALSVPALADDLEVTTNIGGPLSTATAKNSTAGNITIDQGVRVLQTATGAAVTLNSNNFVLNSGVIQSIHDGNATGVLIQGGTTGNLTLGGTSGGIICVSTDCLNYKGTGTGNTGIWLAGPGGFTGNIDLQYGGTIVVTGTNANGILLDSQLTGNLNAASAMQVIGAGATGIRTNATIDGQFSITGSLSTRGIDTYTSTNIDPSTGSVVAIGGNVTKGFVITGPGSSSDIEVTSTLLNSGTDATIHIAPSISGSAADIHIDPLVADTFGGQSFSFVNRGNVSASANDPGISTTGVLLGDTGNYTHTVTLTGGLYNRGRIVATSESDNLLATKAAAAPTDAYGLVVGNGGIVNTINQTGTAVGSGSGGNTIVLDSTASSVDNFYNGLTVTLNLSGGGTEQVQITAYNGTTKEAQTALNWSIAPSSGDGYTISRPAALLNDGLIQASMSGNQTGNSVAVRVLEHGTLSSLINTGTISALATTTDTSIASLNAYAIQDLSGTLVNITNTDSGRIAASATTLKFDSQRTVAVDLSHTSARETFTNTGSVFGDVLFGSAPMANLTVAGNQFTIDGVSAVVNGSVLRGTGTLDINISGSGTGGSLQTTNTRATTLNVGSKGGVGFTLSRVTGTSALIETTGSTTFADTTTMAVTPTTFLPQSQTYTLVQTDTSGALHLTAPATTTNVTLPYMYKGTVTCDGGACAAGASDYTTVQLTLQRKSAAELGLTGNDARIYSALGDAALGDDPYGAALLTLSTAAQVKTAIDAAVPDVAGGVRALSIAMTDQATGVVASRQRGLMTAPQDTRSDFHFWGQEFYNTVSQARSSTGAGFGGAGQGIAVGGEWGALNTGRYGVGYTFFSSQETELHPRDTKTNGDWNMVSAYAGWRFGDVFVSPQANVAQGTMKTRRTILITSDPSNPTTSNSFLRSAKADWSGYLGSAGISTGYIVDFGAFQIIPELSFDGLWVRETAYKESGGGGMGLSLKSQDQKSVRAFAGVLGQGSVGYEGGSFMPQFVAGLSHEFMTSPSTIDGSFESAPGSPFHLVGPTVDPNRVVGGMSFAYVLRNWSAGVNYDASASSGSLAQSATISLSSRF